MEVFLMIIVGAGMAGLLAARMLRHRDPVIWERQAYLPNNHNAVLRFRTSQIGDILGIPFKKVNMIKDVIPHQNPIADSLTYSYKNTGAYRSDRSVVRGLVSEERYIAPPDLISRMAEGVKIEFGREYDPLDPHARAVPVISTMPMPALMEVANYDMAPDFQYKPGATITALVKNCDAYVSLLYPEPDVIWSRISITGDLLIIELPFDGDKAEGDLDAWIKDLDAPKIAEGAAFELGVDAGSIYSIGAPKLAPYNKIIPIDDEARRAFMFWATNTDGIYSLGRYATWRPGLLLDDLVKDIRLIDGWIGRSNYHVALRR
jgi:hypothetical protein